MEMDVDGDGTKANRDGASTKGPKPPPAVNIGDSKDPSRWLHRLFMRLLHLLPVSLPFSSLLLLLETTLSSDTSMGSTSRLSIQEVIATTVLSKPFSTRQNARRCARRRDFMARGTTAPNPITTAQPESRRRNLPFPSDFSSSSSCFTFLSDLMFLLGFFFQI